MRIYKGLWRFHMEGRGDDHYFLRYAARAGETSRKALSSVITTLMRLRANLVGVVLNEVHREVSAGYYYYYGHYSKYYHAKSQQG